MHREDSALAQLQAHQLMGTFSDDELALGAGIIVAVTNAHALTKTQRERLESAYRSIGEFLEEHPRHKDRTIRIEPQGSLLSGTTTRPEQKAEMDVDLVWLLSPGTHRVVEPEELIADGFGALTTYATQHGLGIKRKRRCVQLQYSDGVDGMHADVTPVVQAPRGDIPYGATFGLVPDREVRTYIDTNPAGFGSWFADVGALLPTFTAEQTFKAEIQPLPSAQIFDRLLPRLVQFAKVHRNKAFSEQADLMPPSVVITTLMGQAYLALRGGVFRSPLHLLQEMWVRLPALIDKIGVDGSMPRWIVANPAAPSDNLADRMNDRERQRAFEAWHAAFMPDVLQMIASTRRERGLDNMAKQVGSRFGDAAARGIVRENEQLTNRQRSDGRVSIPVRAAAASAAATPSIAFSSRPHTPFGRG